MHSHQRKPAAPIRISVELSAILIIFLFVSTSVSPNVGTVLPSWPNRFLTNSFQFITVITAVLECAHSVASPDGYIPSSDKFACSLPYLALQEQASINRSQSSFFTRYGPCHLNEYCLFCYDSRFVNVNRQ